ncbi:hypothetical protein D3C86_2085820 [compost metagenome]
MFGHKPAGQPLTKMLARKKENRDPTNTNFQSSLSIANKDASLVSAFDVDIWWSTLLEVTAVNPLPI